MSTTIDSLQIEIKSSSTNAASGIDALAASLEKLKQNGSFKTVSTNLKHLSDSLNGLPNVHSASNSLRTLANSIEKLKGVGSISSISNSLKKLPDALKSLGSIDLTKAKAQLEGVADAVSPLSSVKAGGLSTMVNALKNLDKVTESLDDEKIEKFAQKVELLTRKLSPLSEKMTSISTGFKAINSNAKTATRAVDDFGDGVDKNALNLSSYATIIESVVNVLQNLIQKMAEYIHMASQWDGIEYQFGNAFGEQADLYYDKITQITDALSINKQTFMENSAMATSMLIGFEVDKNDAREMGLGYTELAYDIWAAFNNVYETLDGADGAMAAVRSAIAGEVEPIRRAGFTIVDSQLAITAANHGLEYSSYSATEAQKSYLRYLTLVDQAMNKGIIGTYASEMQNAEGMMRTFSQQLKTLSQAFGSLFLPILVKVMPYLQAFVELLTEGVYWLANFFGIDIQPVDFSDYKTGASTIDKVANSVGGVTDELDKSTESAKELKHAMLGIDELNVISPTSGSAGSGAGAGGAGGGAGGGGYEGLDIGSLWDKSILDGIKADVDAVKEKVRGWMPVIATAATALAGLRLTKLLDDLNVVENTKAFGKLAKKFTDFSIAFAQLAKEGGIVATLAAAFPKLSKALSAFVGNFGAFISLTKEFGFVQAFSAAFPKLAAALAVATPYIGIAAAVVGGLVLAFVEYDFTEVGHTIGKKIGEALRFIGEFLWEGIKAGFNWLKTALDIDDIWDVLAVLFIPGEWMRRITPELLEIFKAVEDWIEGKIENFKGNINEFFGGFFDGLFEGLGWDMSWAEKFIDFFDIQYMDIVEMIINPSSIGKYIWDGIWKGLSDVPVVKRFTDWCDSIVKTVKDFFGIHSPSTVFAAIGKNLIAGLVSAFSVDAIKNKLSSMWSSAKSWWDKKSALKAYTPSIGSIYDKVKERWDNARTWWNDKKSAMKTYTPSIGSIYEKVYDRWKNARDWWNSKKGSFKTYTPSIGSITDKLKSAWNSAKSWWSKNVKLSTKLNISVPTIKVKWDTASAFGKSFKYPTGFSLKFAANGGIFDQGSLVWAGERGPEVLAKAAGGKTGVMNVQQMQDAVYEGVYSAVVAAMRGQSGGGGQDVHVYLDGREINASVKKHQRESGASLMGNEVYAY